MTMRMTTVRTQTDVAEARRQAAALAAIQGLGEIDAGRVALVATELATNLLKHAGQGRMLAQGVGPAGAGGVELIAIDKGPGFADVPASLVDGYSTSGTRGEGLGAVARQAETFDIYSRPGLGAAVLARITPGGPAPAPRVGAVSVSYPGETLCGDGWAVKQGADALQLLVADGLGHGLLAHEAARASIEAFDRWSGELPSSYLSAAHGALRPTRGAAVAMARLNGSHVIFGGIGNIAGTVIGAGSARRMISHNGTLGHVARRFQDFDYPITPPYLVVLHSDGLSSQWSLDRYPGLIAADPSLIAAVLYRDHTRDRDDATVAVAKIGAGR